MDSAEIFVTLGGLLLIGLTLWFFFGPKAEARPTVKTGGEPIYQCPMHSWITSEDPAALCSICGMKLLRRDQAKPS